MPTANTRDGYFGQYLRFDTASKRDGAALAGPNVAVGDIGEIRFVLDENKRRIAWLRNPYGQLIGHLSSLDSYNLAVIEAKGWELRYVLSFTAYSEQPEPGCYWGEVALIAYDPRNAGAMETFLKVFAKAVGDGLRPNPELSGDALTQMLADPANWKSTSKVKLPSNGDGTAVLKDHRSVHDKLLDMARSRNVGCYVVSWAFILALVALVVFGVHSCGLF